MCVLMTPELCVVEMRKAMLRNHLGLVTQSSSSRKRLHDKPKKRLHRRLVFSWTNAFNEMYQASLEFSAGWEGLGKILFVAEV